MLKNKRGVFYGLASGLTWGVYTIFLYSILNLFAGDQGSIDSAGGWLLIITTALVIGLCDCILAMIVELAYLAKKGLLKEYVSVLCSKSSFGILPAALFSGLLGAVPYAIAGSYSPSVAGSISASFPAIGAIVAVIWFKERLTKLKFLGIIICIVGSASMYGLSGGKVPFFVYMIAFVCAIGYAMEGCFGYNMMRGDISSSVTTTLRRTFLIGVYIILLVVISLSTKNFGYIGHLIASFDVNAATYPFLGGLIGNKGFIWLMFFLGSTCSGISYICWYYAMEYSGVATAQVLNITYGIWITVLLCLPPFLTFPTIGTAIGSLIVFGGAVLVVRESNTDTDIAAAPAAVPLE